MMPKIHFISVTEPLIFDMAVAIHEKEYEVSVSGKGLADDVISQLREMGCECHGDGWFPDNLTKDIQVVVLGADVKKDNPELLQAKKMGLLMQSVPEFIYERTKSKTRVVVAGSQGKSSVLSMITYTLQAKKVDFDYILSGRISTLPSHVRLSFESRIALIEGDEHITSAIEKRFQLEFYRPHIAVLTGFLWSEAKDHKSPEEYLKTYTDFTASIERQGKLIYFAGDETINRLVEGVREDITPMPYTVQTIIEENGQTFIKNRYGSFPVRPTDKYFLTNVSAACLVCRQLGVKDSDFFKALSAYSLSLPA
ncbi:UDP-N-acetylmuramate--L-alanine ligase [Bacteroidales bacterium Barb4]|nr:UDP-N-acetylmuramate--L-alanine ligase [Bacteroidales bacterium Barb4]